MNVDPIVAPVPVKVESVKRRYAATLLTQFVQLAASVVTAGVVPRALGPAVFGNYSFLLNTATTLRSFLDPSTSQAFFTFSSQDRRSGSLTRLYALVLLAQLVIILCAVGVLFAVGVTGVLWPGQIIDQIILISILEWTLFVAASLRQLGDSKALTVHAQLITLSTALVNLVGLLSLNALGRLNFYSYAWLNMFTALLIGLGLVYWLIIVNRDLCWVDDLRDQTRDHIRRWWRFASPLILLEYYKPLAAYLSIYLLQRWYGSVEQGHFALAAKWSSLVLVFTSSALMIFWREIANAMANHEQERAAALYMRFTNLLFFLSLVLCTWLSFSSSFLVKILVGDQYALAVPILAVMAFYPLQQTYGQINVAALKGAEKTGMVRNLGILVSIPDLLLSYFLLASKDAPIPGLNLGAMGVALRMVVYGLLSTQIYEWMSHRLFGLNYLYTFFRKLGVAVLVALCALCSLSVLGNYLTALHISLIFSFVISSILYFVLVGTFALLMPDMLGVNRSELLEVIKKINSTIYGFFHTMRG